jgi:hypothetical protein
MANGLTAVIVDDEEAPRTMLTGMLKTQPSGHPSAGVAEDVPAGIDLIRPLFTADLVPGH